MTVSDKIYRLTLFLVFTAFLPSCAPSENKTRQHNDRMSEYQYVKNNVAGGDIYLFTDPDTGIEYLIYRSTWGAGITPRLGSELKGQDNASKHEND